jgi:hypothetical protein
LPEQSLKMIWGLRWNYSTTRGLITSGPGIRRRLIMGKSEKSDGFSDLP